MCRYLRPISSCAVLGAAILIATPATAQSVEWVTQPPIAIQGGEQILVQWEVAGFEGALTENAVAWGQPVWHHNDDDDDQDGDHQERRDPKRIARAVVLHGDRSPDQLDGNCAYAELVTVPVVTAQETIYYTVVARSDGRPVFEAAVPVLVTPNPASATYVPDAPGSAWTYRNSDTLQQFTTVVRPEPELVGCAATTVLETLGSSTREYLTVKTDGVYLHRIEDSAPPFGNRSIMYDPPLKLANTELIVGDVAESSGTWTGTLAGGVVLVHDYTSQVTVQTEETVWVPAGVFQTFRIFLELRFEGTLADTATFWVAPGVGIVQALSTVGNRNRTLLNTNLP